MIESYHRTAVSSASGQAFADLIHTTRPRQPISNAMLAEAGFSHPKWIPSGPSWVIPLMTMENFGKNPLGAVGILR